MSKSKTIVGALHGVMRGNLRQNRDRRYTEAAERQAKYNDKHGGVNLSEKGAVHLPSCPCNKVKESVEVVEPVKEKKVRKRKVKIAK